MLAGSTGLVLPATAQNPVRLVYGSAALVASLRGQQSHFATLPIIASMLQRFANSCNIVATICQKLQHCCNYFWHVVLKLLIRKRVADRLCLVRGPAHDPSFRVSVLGPAYVNFGFTDRYNYDPIAIVFFSAWNWPLL